MEEKALTLDLLFFNNSEARLMLETTVTDIFDGNSKTFHEKGLYSNKIYGTIGSNERYQLFSYKHLGLPFVHPRVYKHILSMDSKYEKIVKGKLFVIFNEKTKVFDDADFDTGFTGYSYFVKYIMDIKLPLTDSDTRKERIKTINKYREAGEILIENLYIMPAGMREYMMSDTGRDEEDEINDIYKSIIRLSNMVINSNIDKSTASIMDPTILRLQNTLVDVYEYIIGLIEGKHKRLRGDWLTRSIDGGVGNVISSIPIEISDLDDTSSFIGFNDTVVGLFQFVLSYHEMIRFQLLNKVLYNIFNTDNNNATLYSIKTLTTKQVTLPRKEFELWTTTDGLNDIAYKLLDDEYKTATIVVHGHYLVVLEDVDGDLYFRFNSDDIINKDNVYPITYGELYTIVASLITDKVASTLSRYPVTTQGSNYLTIPKLFTTTNAIKKRVHIPNLDTETIIDIPRYPNMSSTWINTMGPHYTRVEPLGADFDGDKGQMLPVYSEEAVTEIKNIFNDITHHVKPDGTPTYSLSDVISELVVKTITK